MLHCQPMRDVRGPSQAGPVLTYDIRPVIPAQASGRGFRNTIGHRCLLTAYILFLSHCVCVKNKSYKVSSATKHASNAYDFSHFL